MFIYFVYCITETLNKDYIAFGKCLTAMNLLTNLDLLIFANHGKTWGLTLPSRGKKHNPHPNSSREDCARVLNFLCVKIFEILSVEFLINKIPLFYKKNCQDFMKVSKLYKNVQ